MKWIVLTILFFTLFFFGCKVIKPENPFGSDIIICNECGYAATFSLEIELVSAQYKKFDTTTLFQQFSDNSRPLLQFFSAACIYEYESNKKILLNDTLQIRLKKYIKSNEKVVLSMGCTDHRSFSIREFFYIKEFEEKTIVRDLLGF